MLFVAVLLGLLYETSASNAWYTNFKAGTEYYVGPNVSANTGSGTRSNPYDFAYAAREQQKGDSVLYWLLPGNYTSGT